MLAVPRAGRPARGRPGRRRDRGERQPLSEGRYDGADVERWAAEAPKATGRERGPFVRDRARVLHSAALRRLAAKTQVLGVGESDFPRTRLTHSLECAQIGRELALALGCDPDLVDAACLAHDLGHPPYGHNGETALDEWARDAGGFEGNAQSLRILTRLEAKVVRDDGGSAGLNLTRATLDAATKYPWPRRPGTAKFGVYDDDLPVFTWLREGAAPGAGGDARCVEAQVMDWADDVAYSVHDVEDGIQVGLVRLEALDDPDDRAAVLDVARSSYAPSTDLAVLDAALTRLRALPFLVRGYDGSLRALAAVKRMTSELTARLTAAAIDATRSAYDGPVARRQGAVVVPEGTRAECAVLKAVAELYVMRREDSVTLQARQREQLVALCEAVLAGAPGTLEPWLRGFWDAAGSDAARQRVVVDQVASLTDTSARARWQALVRR